jgi:hypothetical protein
MSNEEITMHRWSKPEYYWGFSPDGDYGIYAINRDSPILGQSNFDCIKKVLEEFIVKNQLPEAPTRYDSDGDEMPGGWVYDFEVGCWAHGWRKYLMLNQDAPQELIEYANEIVEDLKHCYPIFDEDDYTQRQDDAIWQYWKEMSVKWRAEECREAGVSIFAARRDELPPEVYDRFYENGSFA